MHPLKALLTVCVLLGLSLCMAERVRPLGGDNVPSAPHSKVASVAAVRAKVKHEKPDVTAKAKPTPELDSLLESAQHYQHEIVSKQHLKDMRAVTEPSILLAHDEAEASPLLTGPALLEAQTTSKTEIDPTYVVAQYPYPSMFPSQYAPPSPAAPFNPYANPWFSAQPPLPQGTPLRPVPIPPAPGLGGPMFNPAYNLNPLHPTVAAARAMGTPLPDSMNPWSDYFVKELASSKGQEAAAAEGAGAAAAEGGGESTGYGIPIPANMPVSGNEAVRAQYQYFASAPWPYGYAPSNAQPSYPFGGMPPVGPPDGAVPEMAQPTGGLTDFPQFIQQQQKKGDAAAWHKMMKEAGAKHYEEFAQARQAQVAHAKVDSTAEKTGMHKGKKAASEGKGKL